MDIIAGIDCSGFEQNNRISSAMLSYDLFHPLLYRPHLGAGEWPQLEVQVLMQRGEGTEESPAS